MTGFKKEIIDVARKLGKAGLVHGTWGNISLRTGEESMLITPSGVPFPELTEDQLVEMSLYGDAGNANVPSTEWRMHAAVYLARKDCAAVLHTHSTYAMTFAVARKQIPPVLEELAQVAGGAVPVAEYALPGTQKLADNAVRMLGKGYAVLLAAHGLLGVSSTLAEALKICHVVEHTARVTLYAKQLGEAYELNEEEVNALHKFYISDYLHRSKGEGKYE